MAPVVGKKQALKQAVPLPDAEEEEEEVPVVQTGVFEFVDGSRYEGQFTQAKEGLLLFSEKRCVL